MRDLWREIAGNIKGSENYFGIEIEKEKVSDYFKELRLNKEETEIKSWYSYYFKVEFKFYDEKKILCGNFQKKNISRARNPQAELTTSQISYHQILPLVSEHRSFTATRNGKLKF